MRICIFEKVLEYSLSTPLLSLRSIVTNDRDTDFKDWLEHQGIDKCVVTILEDSLKTISSVPVVYMGHVIN